MPVPSRRIVIGVEHSENTQNTFAWAIKEILQPLDDIVLVHVRPNPTSIMLGHAIPTEENPENELIEWTEEEEQASHALLLSYKEKLILKGFERCTAYSVVGNAKHELTAIAHELQADLLVLGSKHKNILKRIFSGPSVSDYCAHHCKCTVVISHA